MNKRIMFLLLLILPAVFMTGCWDMIDIEKQAFVLGIGVDTLQTPEGNVNLTSPPPFGSEKRVHMTLETFSPHLSKNTQGRNTNVIHQDGVTSAEALRLAQAQISRKLSLAHLRAVTVGEEYARQGIQDLISCLERFPQIADRFRLVIMYKNRAETLLMAPLVTERNVSEIITKGGELDFAYSFHRTMSFNQLYEKMNRSKGTVYTTLVNMDERKWISKIGAAVFKDWKLIDYLDAYEVRSANWITGKVDMATVVEPYDATGALASYLVSSAKSNIKPVVKNGRLSFLVTIKVTGTLSELASPPPEGINTELMSGLEGVMADRIKKEVEWIIAKAQKEHQADYLDFGHALNNKYPDLYKSLDWEKVFPDVPVEVRVEAKMTGIGSTK